MRIPSQARPMGATMGAFRPSDCPDGDINVTLPNGTTAKLHNAIGCCYSYPNCNPCSGSHSSSYDRIIGEHFPQCGTNNSNNCYYYVNCNGI